MFGKSIDNKGTYTLDDGTEVVDLGESIFDPNKAMSQVCSIFKIRKEYEMRPDLVSETLYGTSDYTEMIVKYSLIGNPFALEADDYIYAVSMSEIYNPVKDDEVESNGSFDAVKNYHKYIDKTKVPNKIGSDSTKSVPNNTDTEANISKTGDTGITVKDGKIYFGDINKTITSVDSSIVECGTNGMTLGNFLNKALRNNVTK